LHAQHQEQEQEEESNRLRSKKKLYCVLNEVNPPIDQSSSFATTQNAWAVPFGNVQEEGRRAQEADCECLLLGELLLALTSEQDLIGVRGKFARVVV
jgi:hypothetical protein